MEDLKKKILRPTLKESSREIIEYFVMFYIFLFYFQLLNIFLFITPPNGALTLSANFRLHTDTETLFCLSRCGFCYIKLKSSHRRHRNVVMVRRGERQDRPLYWKALLCLATYFSHLFSLKFLLQWLWICYLFGRHQEHLDSIWLAPTPCQMKLYTVFQTLYFPQQCHRQGFKYLHNRLQRNLRIIQFDKNSMAVH